MGSFSINISGITSSNWEQMAKNGNICWGTLTIINYVTGGVSVPLSAVPQAAAIDVFLLGTVPAGANSLGVPLFAIENSATGAIELWEITGGVLQQIPATNNLNAMIMVAFHVSQWISPP
jgi:hypothetical protein